MAAKLDNQTILLMLNEWFVQCLQMKMLVYPHLQYYGIFYFPSWKKFPLYKARWSRIDKHVFSNFRILKYNRTVDM